MELRKAITNSMVEELSPVEKELSIAITNTMVGEMKHLVEVIKIGKEWELDFFLNAPITLYNLRTSLSMKFRFRAPIYDNNVQRLHIERLGRVNENFMDELSRGRFCGRSFQIKNIPN